MHINQLNEIMSGVKRTKDELYVGMCGTQFVGSDRYACVITEILTPKKVRVSWIHDSNYRENIETDENGNEYVTNICAYLKLDKTSNKVIPVGKIFKLRKNGRWIEEGQGLWSTGSVSFGEADEYRDPNF